MFQSQSYQTANYRGNQPGIASLSPDSTITSGFSGTQNVTSQYRGLQTTSFQPSGFVSSAYGQNVGTTTIPSGQTGLGQTGQFGQTAQYGYPSSQQYHTANYRGNQPGHDDYLRSDSNVPAQRQYGIGAQGFAGNVGGNVGGVSGIPGGNIGQGFAGNVGIGTGIGRTTVPGVSFQAGQTGFGQTGQTAQYGYPSSEQYHTANYRGNQPGHDDYLRSDSNVPAQRQFGIGAQGISGNVGGGFGGLSGTAGGNIGRSSGGAAIYQGQATIPSAQSYHTANYRGNQPGHDAYLRSDSQQPAQQQLGIGLQNVSGSMGSSFGTGSGFLGR